MAEQIVEVKEMKQLQKIAPAAATTVMQTQTQTAEPAKKRISRKRPSKKGKIVVVKSKRKTSVARAYIKAGNGHIRINGTDIGALEFKMAKDIIVEPLSISAYARDQAKKLDIIINIKGGGASSQIQAAKGALAKGIVEYTGSDALKKEFLSYDRALIVDDSRRVEPKKFKGPKARARFQTSYR
jgi:small subunit ribosomal protein S9